MTALIAVAVLEVVMLGWLGWHAWRAPMGYETERGMAFEPRPRRRRESAAHTEASKPAGRNEAKPLVGGTTTRAGRGTVLSVWRALTRPLALRGGPRRG